MFLGGCASQRACAGGPASAVVPFWGIDAGLTRYSSDRDFPQYVEMLLKSGVRTLRERDVGTRTNQGAYLDDVRPRMRAEKAAGFAVIAFASLPDRPRPDQAGDALPEDLITVFDEGAVLARDFEGLVDAWEMVGEADVGYCPDLPDRVTAYQKALYLGIHSVRNRASPLVVMGALAEPPGPWLQRARQNGLLDYTDAYNFHFYGRVDDFPGVVAAHLRQARRSDDSPLPLWISEIGANGSKGSDLSDLDRRALQARFILSTAKQAAELNEIDLFMPFDLVHRGDPFALTLSPKITFPAWDAYAQWTATHPRPARLVRVANSAPNPIVLQFLPDNRTVHPHKVSGSYRFIESSEIRGALRIYNFSTVPISGQLLSSPMTSVEGGWKTPLPCTIQPHGEVTVPLSFKRTAPLAYINRPWTARFTDKCGLVSAAKINLESSPDPYQFHKVALRPDSTANPSFLHHFTRNDQITTQSGQWTGVNGIKVVDLHAGRPSLPDLAVRLSVERPETDPWAPTIAALRLKGLADTGFIRLESNLPLGKDCEVLLEFLDRHGQRFGIWEELADDASSSRGTDIWLNLADFHLLFWGNCSASPVFRPGEVNELQLRCYFPRTGTPVEVHLSQWQAN